MPKRFTATEIWVEDWFLDMPNEYKLFWYYMLSKCDHAGLYRVNLRSFCGQLEVKLTTSKVLEYFNYEKQRIRVISERVWLIEDFFSYQYGHIFNWNNRVHSSVGELYLKHKIELTSIRGLNEVKDGVKDKDIDSLINTDTVKQNQNGKTKNQPVNFRGQGEQLLLDRLSKGCKSDTNRKEDSSGEIER